MDCYHFIWCIRQLSSCSITCRGRNLQSVFDRILCCHNIVLALQLVPVWMWFLNDHAVNSKIIGTRTILPRDFQCDKFPRLNPLWSKLLIKQFNHFSSRLCHCGLNLLFYWSGITSISTTWNCFWNRRKSRIC